MDIDIRSIVYFLSMQGKSPTQIQEEINHTYNTNIISYSTITKYLRQRICAQNNNPSENSDIILKRNLQQELILGALQDNPYSSIRQIAYMTGIPKSSVYEILTTQLMYQIKRLRFIPHFLNSHQKAQRVKLSKCLLQTLENSSHQNFDYFYTGDESWFYLINDHEKIWLSQDQEIPVREKKMVYSKKYMVTIFWNRNDFLLIDILDAECHFNAEYFINNILKKISELTKDLPEIEHRKITLHFDNAKPHTAKIVQEYMRQNNMKRAPHPPYSPDIAPSDFYLFGYIKEKLKGIVFDSPQELFDRISEILGEISKDTLKKVFLNWRKRLLKVIDTKGNFY